MRCLEARLGRVHRPCKELPGTPRSMVHSYMPGQNPFLTEFAAKNQIPLDAALGGPQTMYPEFRDKMKSLKPPPKTTQSGGVK